MKKRIARFEVSYVQVLNEKGRLDNALEPKISRKELRQLYKILVLTRILDETCIKLQREGRMGTYASTLGQEAHAAIGFAMSKEDWLFPSFREHGIYLARGVAVENILLYFMGSELGNLMQEKQNTMPIYIPVASQMPQSVGAAFALKIKNKGSAVVAVFGDGATSEGDFHEAMNFAGVFKLPVVFVCQNNQYAISVPRFCKNADSGCQTRAETIAQKAIAYGFEGIQVDGNDALAVYAAVKDALKKAKSGKGPTLVEMFTYRIEAHTTSDDPTKYRNNAELNLWKKRDPIERFVKYLESKKILPQEMKEKINEECQNLVEEAVKHAESAKTTPSDMFTFAYEKISESLEREKLEWQRLQ